MSLRYTKSYLIFNAMTLACLWDHTQLILFAHRAQRMDFRCGLSSIKRLESTLKIYLRFIFKRDFYLSQTLIFVNILDSCIFRCALDSSSVSNSLQKRI